MQDRYFVLKNGEPVAVNVRTWGRWFEDTPADYEPGNLDSRRVAAWERGDVSVSTVFLGLDHQREPGGPHLIFETLVRGGEHDGDQDRYSTRAEALAGHERMVELVRATLAE